MPSSPCCEYYGYLPKLVRKPASPASALAASSFNQLSSALLNSTALPQPTESTAAPPSTYTLSKPLTYPINALPPKPASSLRLVIISDTHERHHEMTVPHGDVLLHCGDIQEGLNFCRSVDAMLVDFAAWFNDAELHPHPVKLVIGGNHDKALAGMKLEEVRGLFSPALYLHDESVIIEPAGVRVYGSPRSIANSRWSPNTAFQSKKAWKPFMFSSATATQEDGQAARVPTERGGSDALRARVEGKTPGGPVDILMAHQSPDVPKARHTVEEQPICTYVQQVAPRRVFFCGHLHGAHGMHRLPVPLSVKNAYGIEQSSAPQTSESEQLEEIPFMPCINASMMMGPPGRGTLLPASVVDLAI